MDVDAFGQFPTRLGIHHPCGTRIGLTVRFRIHSTISERKNELPTAPRLGTRFRRGLALRMAARRGKEAEWRFVS